MLNASYDLLVQLLKPLSGEKMEPNEEELIAPEPLEVGDQGLGDDDLGRRCPRRRLGSVGTRTSSMVQRSTSVVVVPYGSPLRWLRMDMAIELVSEVWVMVSHGLLHHQPHEGEGGMRPR